MVGMEYEVNKEGKTRLCFPDEFFRGEFRCDFFVTSNMKRYWASQLEILVEIDRICRKHDITYFADGGTLLGAVRHKGFIPWDDDLDISMLRSDYNRFVSICEKELDRKYCFSHLYNGFCQYFSRVVDNVELKGRRYSLDYYHNNRFCAGVDIFPLDCVAPEEDEAGIIIEITALIDKLAKKTMDNTRSCEIYGMLDRIEELTRIPINRSGDLTGQLGRILDDMCQLYSIGETEEVSYLPLAYDNAEYRFKKMWFDKAVLLDFEYFKLPCPSEYDAFLTRMYGNYNAYVKGTALHSYPVYAVSVKAMEHEVEEKLKMSVVNNIAASTGIQSEAIEYVKMIKYGIKNITVQLRIEGNECVLRIPRENIFNMSDYQAEYTVYNLLKDTGITDEVISLSCQTGTKMSYMLKEANALDISNSDEVNDCLKVLAYMHGINVNLDMTFDLWDIIEKYEALWEGKSFYSNYDDIKNKVRSCYEYTLKQPKKIGITHFDLAADNILVRECEDGSRDIHIIDWEYAGIQDTHIDIAVFALNADYSRQETDCVIDTYFGGDCKKDVRLKIYCYIAICALLFSNYYEYIDRNGRDITQEQASYLIKASEYYDIYCEMLREC